MNNSCTSKFWQLQLKEENIKALLKYLKCHCSFIIINIAINYITLFWQSGFFSGKLKWSLLITIQCLNEGEKLSHWNWMDIEETYRCFAPTIIAHTPKTLLDIFTNSKLTMETNENKPQINSKIDKGKNPVHPFLRPCHASQVFRDLLKLTLED